MFCMKVYRYVIWLMVCCGSLHSLSAQTDKELLMKNSLFHPVKDTTPAQQQRQVKSKDSIPKVKKHDPRVATRRSALIPGWGQAYNREYWKIPIVYGVLAIPAGLYLYNNGWYKKTKFAYEAMYKAHYNKDSTDLPLIDSQLKNLSESSLQSYRNSFRRDRDYSILWFIIAWGLQVADATVFGHLKQFDVSNDLSMDITPRFDPLTRGPGLSLTLNLKNPVRKQPVAR